MEPCCEEHKGAKKEKHGAKIGDYHVLLSVLAIIAVFVLLFNQFQISTISKALAGSTESAGTIVSDIIPKGTPAIYGKELGVNYNDVNPNTPNKADATIAKLGKLDTSINLEDNLLKRYITIASQISCEYCCGADSIIFTKDSSKYKAGDAACGCAHSFAMRGLAKYLLTQHPDVSDDLILEELGKWKVLFFPTIHEQKAQVLKEKGIEMNYINLASNKYRGIEKGAEGGSMVGGC